MNTTLQSDTPRTDAFERPAVSPDFARTLERELSRLLANLERLAVQYDGIEVRVGEGDDWRVLRIGAALRWVLAGREVPEPGQPWPAAAIDPAPLDEHGGGPQG